jgi:lipopolysaccharide cholinephosphotransferase
MKRAAKGVAMAFFKMVGSDRFIRAIIKESNREEQKCSDYVGCKSWCIYGEREIIPAEVFVDTIEVTFEGIKFPAPIGYDAYLRSLYGDYEKDPPIEQQKTHHNFKAYCL